MMLSAHRFVMGLALAIVLCGHWTVLTGQTLTRQTLAAQMLAAQTPAAQTLDALPTPTMRIITANAIVRGRVKDGTGAPIRSAEVRLRSIDAHDSRIAITDGAGQFEIHDLVSGQWFLTASKAGFYSPSAARPPTSANEGTITLTNGQRLSIDVVLNRAGAIAGRIVDDIGEPLADAQVQALKVRTTDTGTQLTATGAADTSDDTGAFRLYALPPGIYYVRAVVDARNGAAGFVNNEHGIYYPGTADPQFAESITVTAGQDALGIAVVIPQTSAGVRVTGTIVSADGRPLGDDTSVELMRRTASGRGGAGMIARVSNGRFAIDSVSPGDYVLNAMGPQSPVGPSERASMPLPIGTSPLSDVAVTLTPTRTITGTIVADDGSQLRPVSISVTVQEFDSAIGSHTLVVRAPGDFSVPGIWGSQAIAVNGLPRGWMVKSMEIAGQDLGSGPLDFSTVPAAATLRVVITDRVGEVSGRVVSKPQYGNAVVIAFPHDETKWRRPSRYVKTAAADDDGTFRVNGLSAMRYWVVAVSDFDTDDVLDPAFLSRMKRSATAFTLGEAEKKTIELPLSAR